MGLIYELAKMGESTVISNKEVKKSIQFLETLASFKKEIVVIERFQRNNHLLKVE